MMNPNRVFVRSLNFSSIRIDIDGPERGVKEVHIYVQKAYTKHVGHRNQKDNDQST